MLSETIKSAAWLAVKLEDARETIKNGRIILKYDNGGGQKGSRANPAYKVYIDLHRTHTAAIEKLLSEIPPGVIIPETQETPLSIIMAKHNKRMLQNTKSTERETAVNNGKKGD